MNQTIKATISAVCIVAVNILANYGISIEHDVLEQVAFAVISAIVVFYGCWKDHDFTKAAQLIKKYGKKALDAIAEEQNKKEG